MSVLVLVEHDGSHIKDATFATVTAASKLGEVHALVAGNNVDAVAQAAAKIAGVSKVHAASSQALEHQLAEAVAPIVVRLMDGHDAFLAPATTTGKNIAPRVAALLDVMQVSDVLSVEGPDTFSRPIYAGNAIATVKSNDAKKVITVRTTAFEKAASEGGTASVEQVDASGDPGSSSFVSLEASESERPELTSAKVIVSGAAHSAAASSSTLCSTRSRTSSAQPLAQVAPRSMPVTRRTTTRSARPARSLLRKSMSRSGFPARSSISPA